VHSKRLGVVRPQSWVCRQKSRGPISQQRAAARSVEERPRILSGNKRTVFTGKRGSVGSNFDKVGPASGPLQDLEPTSRGGQVSLLHIDRGQGVTHQGTKKLSTKVERSINRQKKGRYLLTRRRKPKRGKTLLRYRLRRRNKIRPGGGQLRRKTCATGYKKLGTGSAEGKDLD